VLRSGDGLRAALDFLQSCASGPAERPSAEQAERRSLHQVAMLIARCALAREESRGAHYRTDFPEKREEYQKHSVVSRGGEVQFR
jgi:L-aspartate oxidase